MRASRAGKYSSPGGECSPPAASGGSRHSDSATAPENPPPTKTIETAAPVDKEERARKRIALFRSLFRGREDVYARRWETDDGRSGYVPAAVKDWKAINKSRPEDRKKVDQKTQKFLPVTDAVIGNHLLGRETIGVYPSCPMKRAC